MNQCNNVGCSKSECAACPAVTESVFSGLSGPLAVQLESEKSVKKVRRRQQLVTAGDTARSLLCIRSGWFKLTQRDHRGRDSVVRIIGPGAALGYVEVVTGGVHRLSARAVTDAEICEIGRHAFESALEGSNSVARRLLTKACHSMIEAENQAISRASMSVRERTALILLELVQRFGAEAPEGGIALQLPLSRSDIASLAGTVLESAVRQLSEFKDEGVIELKGRSIVIKKMDALSQICGVAAGQCSC